MTIKAEPNLNTLVIVGGLLFQVALAGWFVRSIYDDVALQAKITDTQGIAIAATQQMARAQGEQLTAVTGQVAALQIFIHDRTIVSDSRNASNDTRLRSVENGQTSVSVDVKNILSVQTDQSADLKQIQSSIAALNTAVALLAQQRGPSK